jgi:hypothetical protein
MKSNILLLHVAEFFLEWEMFQTESADKIKTRFMSNYFLFRNLFRLWDNMKEYCRVGQTTDDNKVQAHCMLGN